MAAAGARRSLVARVAGLYANAADLLQSASPLADLALRLYVAYVFWVSGLAKVQSWQTTLQLFEYEYRVPLLPPALAAHAGTFTELFFPALLALGLGGRLAAAVLFVFNIIAVISYPDLNAAGLVQHKVWGLMLLVLVLHGPGALTCDRLLRGRFPTRT
ncbi:MAG: DoxX family protein [Gammaproteobacteria bacterium]|nr:DoxX family protein [Gammaproteobacteria bacterium]